MSKTVTSCLCLCLCIGLACTLPTKNNVTIETSGIKTKRSQSIMSDWISSLSKSFAPQDPESARFDSDSQSKKMFTAVQSFLINILKPQPIVDSIRDDEKYGNDGEKFGRVGRTLVNGVATLTNFLGTAVDGPVTALKGLTRKATAALNDLGAKIVGLQ